MTRFATGATWEIPDYKLNQVCTVHLHRRDCTGMGPSSITSSMARPADWVTYYSLCSSTMPRAQKRTGKGSILLWRRFNFPIFLLFIYGQNQLLKRLQIGNRKYALNLKNICFLYNLYFSPIDVLVKKSSDFWSHFYFIWLLTPTLVKDKI